MNILIINPTHPSTPHISAVRAWRFAQELAKLGHRVVLLTATGNEPAPLRAPGPNHDWRQPCVVACAEEKRPTLQDSQWLPRPLRRISTAWHMLRHGGASARWERAAIRAATTLPSICAPDVVWATFGRMEALFAARQIALRLRTPWVLDIKDNWELYVPHGLRKLMAWRTCRFAAVTANAEITRLMARRWHGVEASLIYSGVEDFFFTTRHPTPVNFDINLVGGIYHPERLREFLIGVATWYRALPPHQRIRTLLRYIGSQVDLVRSTAHTLLPNMPIELPGYVSAHEMARLCQGSGVNAYINHSATFHHKLLELLACGRPVLAYPSESRESVALAAPAKSQLQVLSTSEEVARELATLSASFFDCGAPPPTFPNAHVQRYSWPAQAKLLENVLTKVLPAR